MNTLIRFLTFSASRPTHWYEREVYMLARGLLALVALVPSLLVSTPRTAPWFLLSTIVSLVGAWSAQVARSGAARREETRRARGEKDVDLSCDAELRRSAAIGSFFASLAPMIALGMTVASAPSTMTLVAGIAGAVGSAFGVAWSAWIYPAWRRVYTRERDRLRIVAAVVEHGAGGLPIPNETVTMSKDFEGARLTFAGTSIKYEYVARPVSDGFIVIDEPEDAPTEVMTRFSDVMKRHDEMIVLDASDGKNHVYVRCESLDDLLAKVSVDFAEIGTRLYLNDDSPVVECGEGGWFVDWLDGTTGPVSLLSDGKERERFLAMAAGDNAS